MGKVLALRLLPMAYRLADSDAGMVGHNPVCTETGHDGGSVIAVEADDCVKIDGVSDEIVLSLLSESFPLRDNAPTLAAREGGLTDNFESAFSSAGKVAFRTG